MATTKIDGDMRRMRRLHLRLQLELQQRWRWRQRWHKRQRVVSSILFHTVLLFRGSFLEGQEEIRFRQRVLREIFPTLFSFTLYCCILCNAPNILCWRGSPLVNVSSAVRVILFSGEPWLFGQSNSPDTITSLRTLLRFRKLHLAYLIGTRCLSAGALRYLLRILPFSPDNNGYSEKERCDSIFRDGQAPFFF